MNDNTTIQAVTSALQGILEQHAASVASTATEIRLLRKELLGNGQPGRITKLETAVEDLKAHRQHQVGWLAGAGAVGGAIAAFAVKMLHWKP